MRHQWLNMDCLEYMKKLKENEYDLIITDVPYGIHKKKGTGFLQNRYTKKELNKTDKKVNIDKTLDREYIDEMLRVSKQQIIFGGNYYLDILGNCKEPIIWDKQTGKNYFADGEFAWSSFQGTLRIFRVQQCGCFREDRNEKTIHPFQKPVKLWIELLEKYSKTGDKILDPFAGSFTTAVACYYLEDREYTCIEKDTYYYQEGAKRIKNEMKSLFKGIQ